MAEDEFGDISPNEIKFAFATDVPYRGNESASPQNRDKKTPTIIYSRRAQRKAQEELEKIMRELSGEVSGDESPFYSKLKKKVGNFIDEHSKTLEIILDWVIGLPFQITSRVSPFLSTPTSKRMFEESNSVFGDHKYMGSPAKAIVAGIGTIATAGIVLDSVVHICADAYLTASDLGLQTALMMPKIELLEKLYNSFEKYDLAILGTAIGLNLASLGYEKIRNWGKSD